jgi:uncharacterized membrane protein
MRTPFSLIQLVALLAALMLLVIVVQVGIMTIAFDKLGLSPHSAFLLLFASLFGSLINLPLFFIRAEPGPAAPPPPIFRGLLRPPLQPFEGKTLIAVNVGGAVIPVAFSAYLFGTHNLPLLDTLIGIAVVTAISRLTSRPIPGFGIGMPILVAPLAAAIVGLSAGESLGPPLAYISGTLGVLIGADVLRVNDIRRLGTPFASIGGAGTFDGVFLTGIIAVLLA